MKKNDPAMTPLSLSAKIWLVVLAVIGGALMLYATLISILASVRFDTLAMQMLGMLLLMYAIFYREMRGVLPRWLTWTVGILCAVLLILSMVLGVYGRRDNVTFREDAVIVLGSGIRGATESSSLEERLEAAVQYHQANPEALIVVSGGQEPWEHKAEAWMMEEYLLKQGVPQEVIFKEEASRSTRENLENSRELLDERLGTSYTVALITNDYHIYRASAIANQAGFSGVTHMHCRTGWTVALHSYFYECLSVARFCLFGA